MEKAGEKQLHTHTGNNGGLRNINTRGFAQKTFNHRTLLLALWIVAGDERRSKKISSLYS